MRSKASLLMLALALSACVPAKDPIADKVTLPKAADQLIKESELKTHAASSEYKRCVNKARKSKKKCAVDVCSDAYLVAIFPMYYPNGGTNVSRCLTEHRERIAKVKCVRESLKIQDEAERIVRTQECG